MYSDDDLHLGLLGSLWCYKVRKESPSRVRGYSSPAKRDPGPGVAGSRGKA